MNQFVKSALIGLMAIAVVGTPVALHAQATNAPAPEKRAARKPVNQTIPFRGNVKAIDNNAKTISIGKEIIQVTSDTKIVKLGKPATLADGAVDDAVTIRFGPKRPSESSATKTNAPQAHTP